ncbi:MAG TPA: HIT family protein [Candidatus Saccharimonadales bacterium]|nr:HIT family protein [Candidatus Saccharimonadales bacterium]
MNKTIFDEIVAGRKKSWKIWEDDSHLAFLSLFPNTPGLTVVVPKNNIGDYVFSLPDNQYSEFLSATKKVAKMLERAFDTPRVALVFEGTGVAYVHAKLYPLHGELASKTDVWSDDTEFVNDYRGWITTMEGPEMSEEELAKIQKKIIEANE